MLARLTMRQLRLLVALDDQRKLQQADPVEYIPIGRI